MKGGEPLRLERVADNYNYLWEQPTLFYAMVLVIWALGHTDPTHLYAAWAYCVLRLLHSLVQITINHVWLRFKLFFMNGIALAVMLIREIITAVAAMKRLFQGYFMLEMWRKLRGLVVVTALIGEVFVAHAQPLNAVASDPNTMGWMQGFPPPEDRIIGYPASDYFSFPKLRWTFCHFREIQATKRVGRGIGPASLFAEALDPAIDNVTFTPIGGKEEMTWKASLYANYTDGMLILHRGEIVYEYYSGCLDREGRHGAMSVTKSFVGTVAEILIAEGTLDESKLVSDYVPELKPSAFGNATVREVMDMTTALDYNENYADPESDIWLYAAAGDPTPKPESYSGPRNFYEFLQGVEPEGTHGEAFIYKSINTDALAWVIARATGRDFIEHLSERIWKPLGMEQEADMMIDSLGTPFSAGGLNLSLRDAARFGQMLLQQGVWQGEQVIPVAAVQSISGGGDPIKFAGAGYTTLPGGSYRSQWWVLHNKNGAYSARGIHGQAIYIDPATEMVIARFATFPISFNAAIDPTSLPAYQAVADYLVKNPE